MPALLSRHLSLLRCPSDEGTLRPPPDTLGQAGLTNAIVTCELCGREYVIKDGILALLESGATTDEASSHEQTLWDLGAQDYDAHVTEGRAALNAMEIPPTLRALGMVRNRDILELGCGTGRLSTLLAPVCRELLAVDFSADELAILGAKLGPSEPVSLVQADVTRPLAAPRSFDLILSSQVVQALPTREHRMSMFRWAAEAMRDTGRFVFTTYHHGLRNRILGIAQAARYTEGGIYRYYSTMDGIRHELRPYFDSVRVRPIQVVLPGAERLGLPPVKGSQIFERVPGVRQLGILLLVEAAKPVRPPIEGSPSMAVEDTLTLLRRRLARAREQRGSTHHA